MEVAVQDSVERLMRHRDFQNVLDHIEGRRKLYLESLTISDPSNVARIAQAQGQVMAMNEVLRIPEDAAEAKRTRNG